MTKKFIKAITVALSISLLAPFASRVNALETTTTTPQIIGDASLTMDMSTGEVIYSENAESKHALASTTKLLTSLIFAENKNKTDLIPYSETSVNLRETTLNNFVPNVKPGDTMTADDVMKSVMIFSANDCAIMMAESVAGSIDKFTEMMNAKAAELGATNTHFVNPHGLELDTTNYNYTTAYDLALIAKAAYNNEWIRETMAMDKSAVSLNGLRIDMEQRNKILGVNGNVGGKTGNETISGHCFVGFYNRDNRDILTVVLGSEYGADGMNVFNDTQKVADYSYTAEKVPYKSANEEVETLELQYKLFRFFGPEKNITVPVTLLQDVSYYDNDFNKTHAKISYNGEINNAWKLTGNKEITLTFSIGDYKEDVKGTINLTTGTLFKANSTIYIATIAISIIIIVLIVVLVRIILMRKNRSRRGRYYR